MLLLLKMRILTIIWQRKETFKVLSEKDSEEQLFNTKYVTEEEAKNLLEQEEITGYVVAKGDKIKVVVTTSGINETILKSVVDEIQQTSKLVSASAEKRNGR